MTFEDGSANLTIKTIIWGRPGPDLNLESPDALEHQLMAAV